MKIKKLIAITIFAAFLFAIYENILAFKDGIVGLTKKNANETGCVCHNFKPVAMVSVIISGPSSVRANDSATFVLKIANGPALAGGCDISTSLGNVFTSVLDTTLRRAEAFSGSGFELTHKFPVLFQDDTLRFTFRYVAPSTPNVVDTIFANGNSSNNDTTSKNDKWNYAQNFLVNILEPVGISENNSVAKSFELQQNYPNPFNPETVIKFNLEKTSSVSLNVFDVSGKIVAELINNSFYIAGQYSIKLNAAQFNLTSGVYFYKLTTNTGSELKKMILVK